MPQPPAPVDQIAAATGAIAGACVVLGRRAIFNLPTFLIALVTLGIVWRFKVPEPYLIVAAGLAGLVLAPYSKGANVGGDPQRFRWRRQNRL